MSRDGDIRRWKGKAEAKGDRRRKLTKRVKTSRGRKISSVRWLQRQLNDVYVQRAQEEGYRGRAAYKLIELDDRFSLIRKNKRVVDLGAAPGGWSQVAIQRGAGQVVSIDLLPMEPIDDVKLLEMDFTDPEATQAVIDLLQGPPDLVMSDMASNTTGHPATDHLRIVALVELAAEFAIATLAPGGNFVAKVFQGGSEGELLKTLKANFITVRHFKPDASRTESAETYVIAKTFKGRK